MRSVFRGSGSDSEDSLLGFPLDFSMRSKYIRII
jgi:hypothetical protein